MYHPLSLNGYSKIINAVKRQRNLGLAVNMSFLMTKVGLNVLFSINQSVSHHNIMLLLPFVSQLSNVTSQLKDIYGLGAQLLVMIMMTCGIDLPRRSSYSIQKWNICNRHFNSKFSNMSKTYRHGMCFRASSVFVLSILF